MHDTKSIWDVIAARPVAALREFCESGPARPEHTRRAAGAPDGRAALASAFRLEPSDSNVNLPFAGAVVVPCKCRCRTCEICGRKLGWKVRQSLLAKAEQFRDPALLTLTVDRKHFNGPEEAHTAITEGRFIARLMRLLGVFTWFWVLEFQTLSGSGWPHWHIVVDLSGCPGNCIDLRRAWHLWRDKWGLGGLDLERKRGIYESTHAIMYVTKYLAKMPDAFPLWVLERKKGIRFIGGCKALGSLTGAAPRDGDVEEDDDGQLELFREPRTPLIVRMARCLERSTIFALEGDVASACGCWSFLRQVDASPDDLVELSEAGCTSMRLTPIAWGDGELLTIGPTSGGGVGGALRRLDAELEDREVGHAECWRQRMRDRELEIRRKHARFWESRTA
jgi:hypothetical protein